ncbi:unnamed protein product [Acanthoscelides obtectus]|uniref:Uncharacterized protein n=1 Tax=Acanthoscelides obtectus TaxID=200917 RepID=A0A9P0M3S7_ACAOB|nr:unnamed protein product [Acanthoscelides obtectus]CAK1660173.1 hypothetical protein AOBTE_LOCUS21889 [Acanthoscelides obtectus]
MVQFTLYPIKCCLLKSMNTLIPLKHQTFSKYTKLSTTAVSKVFRIREVLRKWHRCQSGLPDF